MHLKLRALLLINFFVVVGHTQTSQIEGQIFASKQPAVSATLLNQTTGHGYFTDELGRFTIPASIGDSLEVSYLGYLTLNFKIIDTVALLLNLQEDAMRFDEVVITALGLKRETKALGYSIQQISTKELNVAKSTNILDNLGARLAGVSINQGATGVGSTTHITIRGESSFTNNSPLFVVDGIPFTNSTIVPATTDQAAGFQEIDFGSGAMDLDSEDIESITVLKGPAAAALYGSRASAGVILVTTKKGDRKTTSIEVTTGISLEKPFRLPKFQNTFGQGNSGIFEFKDGLGGGINDNITYSYGPQLDQGTLIPQYDSPVTLTDGTIVRGGDVAVHGGLPITPTLFVSHPDNLKDFYETGFTQSNHVALNSSFGNASYRLSYSDLYSKSPIPGVNYKRQGLAARLKFEPIDNLEISSSLNFVTSSSDNRPGSGYGSENINYSLVAWLGRQTDLNPLKQYWQPGLEGLQQYSYNYTFFDNPYFILLENRNSFKRHRLFGNVVAKYAFADHFSLTFRTGLDNSDEGRELRRAYSSNRFKNGAFATQDLGFVETNSDAILSYANTYGVIDVDFSLGANRMDQRYTNAQTQVTTLAQPGVFALSNGASPAEIFLNNGKKRINSVYGVLKLGFKELLYVDITGRNDWSSSLATPSRAENVSFFYPSLSSSVVLSKFLDLPETVSFAKLRGSLAQVGNDTSPFQTSAVFLPQTPVNGQPTFTEQSTIANAKLIPELTTAIELGFDLRFLDDRLGIDATYYNSLTENQIVALPIPISTGYTEQVVNGGIVRSKGIELILNAELIEHTNFKWQTQFNFSTSSAVVEELPLNGGRLTLAYSRVYDNTNQTVWYQVAEGDKIGSMWGTGYLKNDAGQYVIGSDGKYIVDNTLKNLGNYNPDFILGWNTNLSYADFSLAFLFDWRQGGILISRTQALAGVAGQLAETANRPEIGIVAEGVVNVGTTDNPQYQPNTTPISAESYYRQYYDRNHEENNTYDASYLKLRELSLTYSLPSRRIFSDIDISLTGRNLFAFSAIPHFDPEQIAVQGQTFVRGVEDMSYPTSRSIGIKITAHF